MSSKNGHCIRRANYKQKCHFLWTKIVALCSLERRVCYFKRLGKRGFVVCNFSGFWNGFLHIAEVVIISISAMCKNKYEASRNKAPFKTFLWRSYFFKSPNSKTLVFLDFPKKLHVRDSWFTHIPFYSLHIKIFCTL